MTILSEPDTVSKGLFNHEFIPETAFYLSDQQGHQMDWESHALDFNSFSFRKFCLGLFLVKVSILSVCQIDTYYSVPEREGYKPYFSKGLISPEQMLETEYYRGLLAASSPLDWAE